MSQYYPDNTYEQPFDSAFHHAQHQYPGRLPQLHISTAEQMQQWNASQRPRSVQDMRDQVYSPATSVHTTRTAPDTSLLDRVLYHNPDLSRTNSRISSSLPNAPSMLYPHYVSPPFNPSAREESWSSFNLRSAQNGRGRCPSRPSNIDITRYSRMGSDMDNSVLPSDSGYTSLGTSQSLLGNESDRAAPSLPIDFLSQMDNMNVKSVASSVTAVSCAPSDQRSRVSSTRSRKSTSKRVKCPHAGCEETFKCNSEYKKHQLRHDRPWKCDMIDCKRSAQGFTTVNDLARHKKSVHQVDHCNKSYRCVGKNCRNKEKVWPRLDNFKQHVQRMHPNEDEADIIERSKLDSQNQSFFVDEELAVPHMDSSLDLAGMDKSPLDTSMNSSFPLEPSSKRDRQHGSSFDWNLDVMKEEHQKPLFSAEASSATQSAHHHQEPRFGKRRAPGLSSAHPTHIPLPANSSVDPAPKETVSLVPRSNTNHVLSNAPQTKAEQQRMARKQSAAVPSPAAPANIENILSMLQQVSRSAKRDDEPTGKVRPGPSIPADPDAVILTKRDALELVKLIQQSADAAQAAPRRTGRGISPSQIICPREGCGHTFTRDCDMRKHMKRHERPYGCTYPKCYKRFGAKSDWKRHENNQHYQPEVFRCAFETSPGALCGIYAPREEAFELHLKAHGISSLQDAEDLVKRSKIGKNRQKTFWCGFCEAIVQLKTRRNSAWDERFDHIAQHLEKEKKSIEEWVCVEENRTKKKLFEEKQRAACEGDDVNEKEDDCESVGEDEDGDDPLPQPRLSPSLPSQMPWTPMSTNIPQPPPPSFGRESSSSSRKRGAPIDNNHTSQKSKQKRRRIMTTMYCCYCQTGLCGSMQVACLDCGHQLCSNCLHVTEEYVMPDAMEQYE